MDKLTPHCVGASGATAKNKHSLMSSYTAAAECGAQRESACFIKLLHACLAHSEKRI